MIINNVQSPTLSLYYIGANIISLIKGHQFNSICPTLLFHEYCKKFNIISYSYFVNGLDWLYITQTIDINDHGDLLLCNL
ncbi:ABC-three component system middle component 6 [Vibrio splendidus]|uniref:ABC-three component system middle component 6 n=1 Tax=Vibrio splendidus TaxID=29497 RepID=UPI0034A0B0E0